jgi:diguanylate cyclase (GGDEF)-like protein/PAS domain S-box-containing protein
MIDMDGPTFPKFPAIASELPDLAARWHGNRDAFHELLDILPTIVWWMSADRKAMFFNRQWIEFTGFSPSTLHAFSPMALIHPDDRAAVQIASARAMATQEAYECEYRLRHHSGEYRRVRTRTHPCPESEHDRCGWYAESVEIADCLPRLEIVHQAPSDVLMRQIVERSPDAIFALDRDGRIVLLNKAAAEVCWMTLPQEPVGVSWLDCVSDHLRTSAATMLADARAGGSTRMDAAPDRLGDTQCWWDVEAMPLRDDDSSGLILVVGRDVTHRMQADARLVWAAQHDPVTNLPNRGFLGTRLRETVREAEDSGTRFTVFLLDVDNFKQTNDTLGHDAGDALLREFGRRLAATLRPTDFIARLGGDEFAVIARTDDSRQAAEATGAAILAALREPFSFNDQVVDCQASIGAALYPDHGTAPSELLKSADLALYGAKTGGRGQLRLFENLLRKELHERRAMIGAARVAIEQDRLLPYYQPKVSLRTGELIGFEALLRWHDPQGGIQLPDRIEPAFQDHRLACAISDRMIQHVIADIRAWTDASLSFHHVAVNVAAAEFRSGEFGDRLLEQLQRAGLPSSVLQLEVTESVFLGRGAEHVEAELKMLSREGIIIALDDFGTGYASLSHLKQFPVDILKIDKSFVHDLHTDPDSAAIAGAVINLGRSLNMKVVAEGIETELQRARLLSLGCEYGQGFLYGSPCDTATTSAFLRQSHAAACGPAQMIEEHRAA